MSSNSANNLLDEALGFNDDGGGGGGGLLLLIEDRVETSGAFILHHLIKRRLSSPNRPNDVVVFLSFAHPFSHYDRILRKMVLTTATAFPLLCWKSFFLFLFLLLG